MHLFCLAIFINWQRIVVYDSDVQLTAASQYWMTHRLGGQRGHTWERPRVFINNPVRRHPKHICMHANVQVADICHWVQRGDSENVASPFEGDVWILSPRPNRRWRVLVERIASPAIMPQAAWARAVTHIYFMLHACWRKINKELLIPTATCFPTCIQAQRLPLTFSISSSPPSTLTPVEPVARRLAAWWRPHKGSPDSRPVTSDATSEGVWTLNHLGFPADLQKFCITGSSTRRAALARVCVCVFLPAQQPEPLLVVVFRNLRHECWTNTSK